MKIIGESQDTFILEASKDEVANLTGYYSKYDDKFKATVGSKIKISAMYGQLYNLKNNQPELKKVVDKLRTIADLLEPVCPVIEAQIKDAIKEAEI